MDADWRIEQLGCDVPRLLGFTPRAAADLLGRRWWEFIPALVGSDADRHLREALRERRAALVTWRHPHLGLTLEFQCEPVGRSFLLRVRSLAGPAPADPAASALTPAAPPANLRAIETALSLQSEPAWLCSALGRCLYANPAAGELLAAKPADLLGKKFVELPFPGDAARPLRVPLEQAVSSSIAQTIDALLPTAPRPSRHEFRFTPLVDRPGAPPLVIVTARRLPEPAAPPVASAPDLRHDALVELAAQLLNDRLAESPLVAALQRMARALGAEIHLHHAVTPDGKGLRLAASGGVAHEQLGAAANPLMGEGPWGAAAANQWPVIHEDLAHAELPDTPELRAWHVRAVAAQALSAGGALLGTLTFATTSRDRFSREDLRYIRDATSLLAAGLLARRTRQETALALATAHQAAKSKDEFFASLAHELRTPLNPVLLIASQGADNATLPLSVRDDFSAIAKSIRVEARLIDDLLDLSRVDRGKLALEPVLLPLHSVLLEALATITPELEEKRLDLALHLAPVSPSVRGDPLRLQQVFWNILKNAAKFTPRGGAISVRTSVAAGAARVEILDTGVGLTPEEKACAFESFSQGEHARSGSSPFGGLGLGLTIARNLVDLHGGRIRVESEGRGTGACFIVELPLAAEPAAPIAPATEPVVLPAAAPPPPAAAPRLRILLVEDHRETREALLKLLVHRDHEVIAAGSIAEARTAALRKEFDLVISDLGLPDGSGYDLMTGLHSDHGLIGIALSGQEPPADGRGRAAGFVAHLVKPVRLHALEAALADAARIAID